MGWGFVETELEVAAWLDSLTDDEFGQAERYIDLLADQGVHLSEPFTGNSTANFVSCGSILTATRRASVTTSPLEGSSCSLPYSQKLNHENAPKSTEPDEP